MFPAGLLDLLDLDLGLLVGVFFGLFVTTTMLI